MHVINRRIYDFSILHLYTITLSLNRSPETLIHVSAYTRLCVYTIICINHKRLTIRQTVCLHEHTTTHSHFRVLMLFNQ